MKEDTLYIWHHLGMGDYLIANGIVRHYATLHDNIVLFYKSPHKQKVKRLYADLPNITFKDGGTKEDQYAKGWELLNPMAPLLKVRLETALPPGVKLEEYFYKMAKVPIDYKWNKFHFERDHTREKEVFYDILGLTDDSEYIFLHDDPRVETKGIPKHIKIIKPDNMEVELYDYLLVMERAQEVHLMSSSFFCLADCIQLQNDELYFHQYIRNITLGPTNLNWNIIT